MATSTDTTTTNTADPWATAMVEWHCAAIDVADAAADDRSVDEANRKLEEAAARETAAARAIFNIPAPNLPALHSKIAVYRTLYTSRGNCFPPEDHHDLVALASIEADVAALVRVTRAGAR